MNLTSSTPRTTSDRLTTVLSYGVLLLLIYFVFRIYEPVSYTHLTLPTIYSV